jgi:transposase
MGNVRFTEDFKIEAIKQIIERGYPVAEVSQRLGVSTHSLYAWIKRYSPPPGSAAKDDQSSEIRRLKQELARVTEERDILKKSHRVFRQATLSKLPCIRPKAGEHPTWRVGMKWRKVCDNGGEKDRLCELIGVNEADAKLNLPVDAIETVQAPLQMKKRGVETKLIIGDNPKTIAEPNEALITLIAQAHHWLDRLTKGSIPSIIELAREEQVDKNKISRAMQFAYLAPDIT